MNKKRIKPINCVRPNRYGEITVTVLGARIPKSKKQEYSKWHTEEIKPLIKEKLKSFEVNPDKQK